MKSMRCKKCGGKDFGRLELRMTRSSGPFTRTIFRCNRCRTPRAHYLEDKAFEHVALSQLLKAQIEESKKQHDDAGSAFRLATGAFVYEIWKYLKGLPPGPDRARLVHKDVDVAIKEHHEKEPEEAAGIRCRSGCNACCYTAVGVTKDEAELLAERVVKGVKIDVPRLMRQQEAARDDKAWFTDEIAHKDRACVFLGEDGKCKVYEDRPSACRKYFVFTDPKFCDVEKYPKKGVGNLVSHGAECITSASYTVDQEVNFLPRALLAALDRLMGISKK